MSNCGKITITERDSNISIESRDYNIEISCAYPYSVYGIFDETFDETFE